METGKRFHRHSNRAVSRVRNALLAVPLCVLGWFVACHPSDPIAPAPADADPEIELLLKQDRCAAACSNLRRLSCPEAKPTPKGAPCEEVCRSVEKSGLASYHPVCVARVRSCAHVSSCSSAAQ